MSVKTGREAEIDGLLNVAGLMAVAARTAPKTRGVDEIVTAVLTGEGKDRIADEMERLYKDKRNPLAFFPRDAGNLRDSHPRSDRSQGDDAEKTGEPPQLRGMRPGDLCRVHRHRETAWRGFHWTPMHMACRRPRGRDGIRREDSF